MLNEKASEFGDVYLNWETYKMHVDAIYLLHLQANRFQQKNFKRLICRFKSFALKTNIRNTLQIFAIDRAVDFEE